MDRKTSNLFINLKKYQQFSRGTKKKFLRLYEQKKEVFTLFQRNHAVKKFSRELPIMWEGM